jgi:hypothetical protein
MLKNFVGKSEWMRPLRIRGIDEKTFLKCISDKYVWRASIEFIWLRTDTDGRLL